MKKLPLIPITILCLVIQVSCKHSNDANKEFEAWAQDHQTPVEAEARDGLRKAYFSSGCFWCVEAIYESVRGVEEAISGYSGGRTPNPSYEDHADHAETVEVIYDPDMISFANLVDVYFGSQNVTQVNGQGPDRGTSYRSIIFYQNQQEKRIIEDKIAALNKKLDGPKVAAQVLPFQKFWKAEDYHQDYEKNHPDNPYIQNVSIPRINKFKEKYPALLKENNPKE